MKRKNLVMIVIGFALMGLSVEGHVTFQKTYGGTALDWGNSVKHTSDGGYIIVGGTESFRAGGADVYLIKTNANGDTLWTKTYGGSKDDQGVSVIETNDNGFAITGYYSITDSIQGLYLLRTNSLGDTLWSRIFGNIGGSLGYSIQQTFDNGFIITGYTSEFGAGEYDVYLIKTNSNGDTLWTKTYGGNNFDYGISICQTLDSGFIIIGSTESYGVVGGGGLDHVYLIKTNSFGDTLWTKVYSGTEDDDANSVQQTNDGGYIIGGATNSFSANVDFDFFLIKTNSTGNTSWAKTYGGIGDDQGVYVIQTTDGGFALIGQTNSFGAGGYDIYVIKTNSNGDTLWTKTYGGTGDDNGNSIEQTSDGGYIITGCSYSFGAGAGDLYLIKTDSLGNSGCDQSNTNTIVTDVTFQIFNPATIVSAGGKINSSPTLVSNGGIITTLCTTEGINEIVSLTYTISLSPNPFTTTTILTIQCTYHNPSLFIYNLLGQVVETFHGTSLPNQQITIPRNQLSAGMYFYKLIEDNKEVLGIGKMIVE